MRQKTFVSIKPIPVNQPVDLSLYWFDEPWRRMAPCTGSNQDVFFPERGASTREAKEMCDECLVRIECLEDAIAHNERFGIWGGLPERARRNVKHLMQRGWDIREALAKIEGARASNSPNGRAPR